MTDTNSSAQRYFLHLVCHASVALGFPKKAIKQLFPGKGYCLLNYYNGKNELIEKMIEIRLDGATLNCLLDAHDRCTTTMLFLDYSEDMDQCIQTCNKVYEYNYITHKWTSLSSSYIELKMMEGDAVFVFTPQNKI